MHRLTVFHMPTILEKLVSLHHPLACSLVVRLNRAKKRRGLGWYSCKYEVPDS
ncbi:hypothetical protein Hanom_Chr04g00352471 [Helianthus anomalus]